MSNTIGSWGLYQWFREHGVHLVHPDDLGAFERLMPNSKVFVCEGDEGEYLVLRYGQERYRAKPELFKVVSPPPKAFGEMVWVTKDGQPSEATVSDIIWHFQRQEPYFLLEFGGRKGTKQYWPSDFQTPAGPDGPTA